MGNSHGNDNIEVREAVIWMIAMASDTNPAGDIFGGWLMAQMNLAAGNAVARRARGRCATFAVDGMVFHRQLMSVTRSRSMPT